MTYSQIDPAAQNRVPWNFDAKIGPKRLFNQKQIWAIRSFLDREKCVRDWAPFDLAIESKFRGCDLVELRRWMRSSPAGQRYTSCFSS